MRLISILLLLAAALPAQQNAPHLAYVYPAGARRGTTVQVTAGGQFLNNVSSALISGRGVRVSLRDSLRPLTAMQATELREQLQALLKQPPSPDRQKQLSALRLKLASFDRNMNRSLAETQTLEITIDPNAAPGRRELRLETPIGLSNPVAFIVGDLPETVEKQSPIRILVPGLDPAELGIGAETAVDLPTVINGRIMPRPARPSRGQPFTPGEADRYRFHARRGQRVVASVAARELIPYLADAVPGWLEPILRLLDASGAELACSGGSLECTIPADGDYILEIRDALYRGREDFVYRIAFGELPFLTSIFPRGGRAGARTKVALTGWNLPSASAVIDAKGKAPGLLPFSTGLSNTLPFALDTLPETLEKDHPQKLKLPVIVNGRIARPGERDVYAIDGRAGQELVAEIYARRLESPLDSTLTLTDSQNRRLAFNDDHDDKAAGLLAHQADSYLLFRLPAKGRYYLTVADAARKGGPEYAYRLRISPPRPDFELLTTPSAVSALRGMNAPLTVYAVRRDGFAGEISLSLKDAPAGVTLAGGRIPAGQDQVRLTIAVPARLSPEPLDLTLEGRATINGKEIVRQARSADDMMQAFAYHHLVPASGLKLAPARRAMPRPPARAATNLVRIPAGGSARIPVEVWLPPNRQIRALRFELSDPPEGLTLRSPNPENGALIIDCDAAKAKPGLKGNLILTLLADRQPPPNAPAARFAAAQRVPLGALPALPFEIK